MIFRIAGLGYGLEFESSPPPGFPDAAYDVFRADCEPDVVIRFHDGPPPALELTEAPVFCTEGLWTLYRVGERWVFLLRLPKPGARVYRVALADPGFRRCDVYTDAEAAREVPEGMVSNPLAYPLGELLIIGLLADGLGLLVHAVGVQDRGRGLLFCGHSGAGKTTLARLWTQEATVLNDDRIVVRRRHDGRLWIHGTPWHGEHNSVSPEGVPLDRVFFIGHGARNEVRPCPSPAAALLARSFPPAWDASGLAWSLEVCAAIAAEVPCHELGFVPDARVLEVVRCVG